MGIKRQVRCYCLVQTKSEQERKARKEWRGDTEVHQGKDGLLFVSTRIKPLTRVGGSDGFPAQSAEGSVGLRWVQTRAGILRQIKIPFGRRGLLIKRRFFTWAWGILYK